MIDDLFARHPWTTNPVPLPSRAGMLGDEEMQLFYYLARDAFVGEGTIVDAGSFLGKSACCFAAGLRANPKFRPHRDRIHCFDDFRVHESNAVQFLRDRFGIRAEVGDSTRALFDRQIADVRELLEVHEGDFHTVAWQHQPIEILMVDIAKSESLGRRVIEAFFPDLIAGRSIVIQQDYHHAWLPHLHVAMEYLAPYFELVAPIVDFSAVFRLKRPIPADELARAAALDFSPAEQIALMEAGKRVPAQSI
jgi:hypothetical protein